MYSNQRAFLDTIARASEYSAWKRLFDMHKVINIAHPNLEVINMAPEPRVSVIESDKEGLVEGEDTNDSLVEVGSVSGQTKGAPLGIVLDASESDFAFP